MKFRNLLGLTEKHVVGIKIATLRVGAQWKKRI
jgi:hypothetical protein